LLIDVLREACGAYALEVARRGAEAEAIEDVNDGPLVSLLRYRRTVLTRRSGASGSRHHQGDNTGTENETRGCSHATSPGGGGPIPSGDATCKG